MNLPDTEMPQLERRLMDTFIRACMVLVLALLCYSIFSPFLALMAWALILAVTLFPLHQKLARRIGDRQGLSATLLVLAGTVLIVAPTSLLTVLLGDAVHDFIGQVRDNTLKIPAPSPGVAEWPVVGPKLHDLWTRAHVDLPGVIQGLQPKVSDLSKKALGVVAAIGGSVLLFVFSFVIAGIMMAFGRAGARSMQAIFIRVVGVEHGAEFTRLCTATIRAVALGVLGVALIQAIVVGLLLLLAGVPFAGVLAAVVLVLGIAQVPALLVTLPAIAYIWVSGSYSLTAGVVHTVLLLVAGMLDNVLKPLMLGRGVDAPMPVVLLGALGGMANGGILGMFVGATFLALGYQIFMAWVYNSPAVPAAAVDGTPAAAD